MRICLVLAIGLLGATGPAASQDVEQEIAKCRVDCQRGCAQKAKACAGPDCGRALQACNKKCVAVDCMT